jgi:chromosome partitioning protein
MTAECIVFANQKGGTGKTTSCLNVAGFLSKNNKKVLVVDFDPQANATSGLGVDLNSLVNSMYDVVLDQFEEYEGVSIKEIILETDVNNLHLAPAEMDLAVAELLLANMEDRAIFLDRILNDVRSLYDYIFIDVPSNTGLLMINGLCASNQIVVPIEPSIFSLETLEGLNLFLQDIAKTIEHSISQMTVILNRYVKPNFFSRLNHKSDPSKFIEKELKKMFQTVFLVPESNKIFEAQRLGIPISQYSPNSAVGRAFMKVANGININLNTRLGLK